MLKIIIKNLQKKIPINPTRIKRLALSAVSRGDLHKTGELTVCFVNDSQIQTLNSRFLKIKKPTDVLAFKLNAKNEKFRADIIISAETALRNATEFGTSPFFELSLYVAHGILHLRGYDDKTAKGKKQMYRRAVGILKNN
ncbi:MAG: rRNA maturation RNase YbeY, partial [Candidatus Omnitrophica bacterium]|nr:rRNA maturation RNase YbeY [Candidatus Omnitrophota bacterium]